LEYMNGIIRPYVKEVRQQDGFAEEAANYEMGMRALLIMDCHWSHFDSCIDDVLARLEVDLRTVPKGATDLFSVLDVAVNKPLKDHLKEQFSLFCTQSIISQLSSDANVKLDVRARQIKPKCGTWLINTYQHLKKNEIAMIAGGWRKVAEHVTNFSTPS